MQFIQNTKCTISSAVCLILCDKTYLIKRKRDGKANKLPITF